MNKEELIGKLQMVYVGDTNALNELIGYYDGLKQGIDELQQENQELKKQLEEWERLLINAKEMLDLQGCDGNYNYDSYMLGLYNGMEYIIALFEKRKPNFKDGKNIEFLDLKQKRNLINKFNKEYDEEDKKKNPDRNYAEIMPDAEEVYRRYYAMKTQQKKFIEYISSYIELLNDKPDLVELSQKDVLEEALLKYKEIIGNIYESEVTNAKD